MPNGNDLLNIEIYLKKQMSKNYKYFVSYESVNEKNQS